MRQSIAQNNKAPLYCSYDFMYEPIYEPSYTVAFIFYDEDEYEEEFDFEENDFLFHNLH